MQQNAVPLVHRVLLMNSSDSNLHHAVAELTGEGCSRAWRYDLPNLAPGQSHSLGSVDLCLSPEALLGVETVRSELLLSVRGPELAAWEQAFPLEVLPFNQWTGPQGMPELLAAFCPPTHPVVLSLLKGASRFLWDWSGDPSLEGYPSRNRQRVRLIAAAVYAATQDLGLAYAETPADFEEHGQKIRTPDQILESGTGNCLDLSCLLAAGLEQAGLHPLLVIAQGHALAGVWLEEEAHPASLIDDIGALRQCVESGLLCLFEASGVTRGTSFEQAEQVLGGGEDRFHYAVDVCSARSMGVRPLPVRLTEDGRRELVGPPSPREGGNEPPADAVEVPTSESPWSPCTDRPLELWEKRLERWKNRLLDLSLRNRLLNFREGGKTTLPLVCAQAAELYQGLAAGRTYGLRGREAVRERDLNVDLSDDDLARRLPEIARVARTSMEETGARILYLAFGFLRWYETPQAETARYAPLLLIPVDLQRAAVGESYRLKQAEEEIRPNLTLLQKLDREFRLKVAELYEIPEIEGEYHASAYFLRVQEAVLDMPRWEVLPDMVRVGLFSFSKLLMWMDLQDGQTWTLLRRLLQGRPEGGGELLTPDRLDEWPPQDCQCVVDADSSQLCAVHAAEAGHSFVLQGPPGTGKSQTITNLIAHSLARGRSVLFVAEKLAALQVVHGRLSQVGLAPFCLELHSNKASKADVVRQLQEAAEVAREVPPQSWGATADELGRLRHELNAYVAAIHRPRPLGRTVFQATAQLLELQEAPLVKFPPQDLGPGTHEHWLRCQEAIASLALVEVGIPCEHVWRDSHLQEWERTRLLRDVELITRGETVLRPVEESAQRLVTCFDLVLEGTPADFEWLAGAVQLLLDCPYPTFTLLWEPWEPLRKLVGEWCHRGQRRQELWTQVSAHFGSDLLRIDLKTLLELYQKWAHVFILGWFMLWGARRRLARTARQQLLRWRALMEVLAWAVEVQELDVYFELQDRRLIAVLGRLWQGPQTDWDAVRLQMEWSNRFRHLLAQREAAGTGTVVRCALQEDLQARTLCKEYSLAYGALREWQERLRTQFRLPQSWALAPAPLRIWLQERQTRVAWLSEWAHYRRCETQARAAGLEALVEAHAAGLVGGPQLRPAFERGYLEGWLQDIYAQESVLAGFSGREQRDRLAQFQKLDEQLIVLTQRKLRAELASRVPNPRAPVTAGSEVSLLRREIGKKRSHLPSRRLFREIPNLLPRLKPCVLMSPLSVAQYLDPALPPFDLVIFDEASQISPWDAVGVLTRARQCIVVGDSKQLPPTSFFEKSEQSENSLDNQEEMLESILDECQTSGLPQLSLLWHYRSRSEDLITFSNRRYYQGKLLTFPAAQPLAQGVSFHFVPGGRFDRGRSRTNEIEARVLVAELVRRLHAHEGQLSYGVVTFNLQQQQLIEHLLEEERLAHPQIERFFAGHEAVFVKNLENVQGDERDVILFSVSYGPDRLGRLYMNFGPLNQQGGPRRLNVAVSRARQEMLVFASLRAEQIDLSRTNQSGVRDFKSFLAFAERGVIALDSESRDPIATRALLATAPEAESEFIFEEQVGQALEERGWELHSQVGCSGYRIDLAVLHPERPGTYLAAVVCDGASYRGAATARDRDRLREQVLRRLGWSVEQVWSTDWWREPARELDRLDRRLRRLLEEEPPPTSSVEPVEEVSVVEAAQPESGARAYQEAQLPLEGKDSKLFRQAPRVRQLASQLISVEAPITVARAVRRLASCWGMKRVGQRTHRFIADQLLTLPHCRVIDEVVWTCAPEDYREARRFDPLELPPAEVANGLEQVLRDAVAVHEADLVRGGARFFGLGRAGKNVEACLLQAVETLVRQGRAQREGEQIRLPH